ncbi:alpha/beta hydrolase [Candidatus Zixiibacteriota bacterium]
MKTRIVLIGLLAAALGLAAADQGRAQRRIMPSLIAITAPDSSIIYADLHVPRDTAATKYPLIALMHMYDRGRSDFEKLIPLLLEQNWAVLNVDLRGHGKSASVRGKLIKPNRLRLVDFRMMAGDLALLISAVRERTARVDVSRLGIIGASIGASVGLHYGAQHPELQALALLSPGLEYKKLNSELHLAEYGNRPVLIMVGKYDTFAYLSSQTLDSTARGEKRLVVYENPKHGTDLFEAVPGADSVIVEWLDRYL